MEDIAHLVGPALICHGELVIGMVIEKGVLRDPVHQEHRVLAGAFLLLLLGLSLGASGIPDAVLIRMRAVAFWDRIAWAVWRSDSDRVRHYLQYLEGIIPVVFSTVLSACPDDKLGGVFAVFRF